MNDTATPIIDVWANWWPAGFFDASPEFSVLYERLSLTERMNLSAEEIATEAARGGVGKIILSATAFDGSPVTNQEVAAIVATNPGLFAGCASVDPRTGMAAVRELRRAVEESGFVGLKLLPFLYDLPPNHAVYYPLYTACVDLGIPVLILTGHTAVALPNSTGHPSHLDAVALHFPELKIIAGHAGYPWTTELVALAWKHENLFIDTSGHLPRHFPPDLVKFMNSYGRGKVMFGTGHPLMNYEKPLADIARLTLKPEAEAAYLGGNALRIWPDLLG